MNYSRTILSALVVSTCALFLAPATQAQTTITQWKFTSTASAPDNSPAPTTGTGTATMLGMTNSYPEAGGSTGSVASGDILVTNGTAHATFSEDLWRIRGAAGAGTTGPNNNGWALAAPQYTQGVEFDVSTVGFQNITVSFDWYATTAAVRNMQEEYTLNGSTWNFINPLQAATPNDYFGAVASGPTNTINLSSISGANNDASFGIRLVSAYDPNLAGGTEYSNATVTGGIPSAYNNSSGNWRFGNITVAGTTLVNVPEPSLAAPLAGGLALAMGLLYCRRKTPNLG